MLEKWGFEQRKIKKRKIGAEFLLQQYPEEQWYFYLLVLLLITTLSMHDGIYNHM